ncbi:MAG: hypothetical protein AB1595_07235 [bacterium]
MYAIVKTGRSIHLVCSPKEDYLAIVSAYIPTLDIWENDYKTRKNWRERSRCYPKLNPGN